MSEISLSAVEVGLLTIADRRGQVATPKTFDPRNDPADVERHELLGRLRSAGYLEQIEGEAESETYAITDRGRAALAELDARRE